MKLQRVKEILSNPGGFIARLSAIYLGISLLLRLVLWGAFGGGAGVKVSALPSILLRGFANDLLTLPYLLLPLILFLTFATQRFIKRSFVQWGLATFTFLTLFGLLYLSVAEYFFFEEFDSRFNLVAVDYLIYPTEVLVNIWESYPIIPIVLVLLFVTAILYRVNRHELAFWNSPLRPLRLRITFFFVYLLLLSVTVFGFHTDTLALSANRVNNELATNGISSFFQALRTNELNYGAFYPTLERAMAFKVMHAQLTEEGGTFPPLNGVDNLNRHHDGSAAGLGRLNVIVVVEESLGAGFVGAYGDQRGLTPNFDALAKEGLLFTQAYATGTRTVRGLEAITASFPPIPSESIIKRPGSEGIATWGSVMAQQGYQTSFLYGGYGAFDNMNPFYRGNGFSVSDRSDIQNPQFANIWGVSDGDLFRHALGYYDEQFQKDLPFFSIIMSTSNHKPYTFPQGVPGVKASGGNRSDGIRYADYALGEFFRQARTHAWFDRTLFVVVADHDARVYGRAQVPVNNYRIPLLVYAPAIVKAQRVATATSQIDIAPTILGMLGFEYTAPFYGRDILHSSTSQSQPILLNHNHNVALLDGNDLLVLGLNQDKKQYRYDPLTDRQVSVPVDERILFRSIAYYQTAFDLFRSHRYQ